MAKIPLAVRIDPGLLAAVDGARGDVSRTRFVERALESAVEFEARLPTPPGVDLLGKSRSGNLTAELRASFPESPSASSRAPEPDAPTTMVEAAKRATLPPGVKTARQLALERQRRLNEGKG